MWSDARRSRQRALSYVLPLLLLVGAVMAGLAWQAYTAVDRELTEAAYTRRGAVAYLAATVLNEKLGRLNDLGLSLASRVRFHELVAAGRWAEASRILAGVPGDFPFVERLTLHDLAGTQMADAPATGGLRGQNFAYRDWYKGVMAGGKPYISPVYRRALPPQINVFAAAFPIIDSGGRRVGILVLQVRADSFFEWTGGIDAGAGGMVYVIDRSGGVAAHPKFKPEGPILDFSDKPVVRRVLGGGRGVELLPAEGGAVGNGGTPARVVAYEPVTEHGWGVVIEQPAAVVFATRDALQRQVLAAYAAVLLLLVFGAYLFSRVLDLRHRAAREQLINAQLELRVAERTAQLEAANRELEGFSYSVSHDLRAPVRAINSFAQMLREDLGASVGDESRRMLKVISDNSIKLGKLIEGLLEFARLGRAAIHAADVDMGALAAEVVAELRTEDPAHPVRFELKPMPPARCDPVLTHQVWTNLIANAIKFSGRKDAALIEIGGLQEGAECTYYVRDNGAGFDMAYYKQLFGMFHRLHADKEFQGTGIGLSIVQRVVDRHGGRVWAESKVGEGASFFFALPGVAA